ncbi:MAG: NINE protein [Jaaginema sp. PMC 1079.18]|nr:NINE protein [Jaaginema sp. PMC 1080.18]MEC4852112.1 NINE protein [Jaaginema sp. PMC 1079.18]MEC4866525.1 NINE protein [Jaaginema sp. PMC 1078.18]
MLAQLLGKPRNQKLAVVLALVGAFLPFSGWHKFYVGQPWWGVTYLLLFFTPIPQIASGIEALWYLAQEQEDFDERFNGGMVGLRKPSTTSSVPVAASEVNAIASAVRELDNLRQEGLLSEYEFEQKRRQLLDMMG